MCAAKRLLYPLGSAGGAVVRDEQVADDDDQRAGSPEAGTRGYVP
jgi:hypothetical protein